MSSTVVKTVILSLVSQTGVRNSTAPPTGSPTIELASNAGSVSRIVALNRTSAGSNNAGASCNAQLISWSSASSSWNNAAPESYVTKYTTRIYDKSSFVTQIVDCTSSCGTSLGAVSYCGNFTNVYETTHVSTEYMMSYLTHDPFPTASPNCSIASSDCSDLLTSYYSALTWYYSITTSLKAVTSPQRPKCTSCVKTGCTFSHGGMDLYYFPVTANVSRDMCASEPAEGTATSTPDPNSTYTEVTIGARTVVNGVTMYEGNIYLSLSEPHVRDNCGSEVLPQYTKPRIITMASSDLFSVRGYPHNVIPYSINWADLNEPVPWSAYMGSWYCWNNRPLCSQVFEGHYKPVMSMPGQIRQLDPNWASCDYDQWGIFDPPVALYGVPNFLTSSSAAADPTPAQPEPVVTETATPGQSGSDGTPSATSVPEPFSSPSDPEKPSSSSTPENSAPNDPQTPNDPQNPTPSDPENSSPSDPTPPGITVGPTVIPVNSAGGIVIDPGTTLSSGGAPFIISSSTFSIGAGGLTIISSETSTEFPFGADPVTITLGPGSTSIVLDPTASTMVLGGTTLTPGGAPITVDDTTLSVGSSGVVVIGPSGTSTIAIPSADPQVITVGSTEFTVSSGSVVLAPGTTIGLGDPAVTISGTVFSVESTGLVVEGGGRASTVPVSGLNTADAMATGTGADTSTGERPSQTETRELQGTAARMVWSGALMGVIGLGFVVI